MIIEKVIKIKLVNGNKAHYRELGYEFSKSDKELTVSTLDIPKNSRIEVEIICDYCGEKDTKTLREITKYNKNINKDCCKNKECKQLKIKESNLLLYGTESYTKLNGHKKKLSQIHRTSKEDILKLADSKNIEILNVNCYENEKTELFILCNNHKEVGIQKTNFQNIKRNKGCCSHGKNELIGERHRLNQNDVFDYFKSRNLIVEPDEIYTRKDGLIKCRCIHHTQFVLQKSLNALEDTDEPCEYCRNEKSISELNRLLRSSISNWRKLCEKECDYKCVLTELNKYEVHHTYSFNSVIKDVISDLNIDINNYSSKEIINIKKEIVNRHKFIKGICLHPLLHILFHQLYSKENNTPEQFEEFKIRYNLGEFNEILNNELIKSNVV